MLSVSPEVTSSRHPFKGIACFLFALLLFACMDTSAKFLAARHPVIFVIWIRYAVHVFLMVSVLGPMMGTTLIRTSRPVLVVIRGLCLVAVSFCMMSALPRLPLAEATSIMYVAPLFVVLFGRIILHERIGIMRAIAALTGFLGVLIVGRPDGALDPFGVALALGAALGSSAYQLLSRELAKTDGPSTLLFISALVGLLAFSLVVPWFWISAQPSFMELALFVGLGVNGAVGHYLYTLAYRYAPASYLAPTSYIQIIWAAVLGWLVFGHVPDFFSLIGMAIVIVAGLAIALDGQRKRE